MTTTPTVVRFRPRRVRVVCAIAAVALVALSVLVAGTLQGRTGEGLGQFRAGDRAAMVGLGVVAAFGVLALARPRVEADVTGIRVRNLIGGYELPWTAVRRVSFDRRALWASLELHDDETVSVQALQAVDKQYAVLGVRTLRALHAAAERSGRAAAERSGG